MIDKSKFKIWLEMERDRAEEAALKGLEMGATNTMIHKAAGLMIEAKVYERMLKVIANPEYYDIDMED